MNTIIINGVDANTKEHANRLYRFDMAMKEYQTVAGLTKPSDVSVRWMAVDYQKTLRAYAAKLVTFAKDGCVSIDKAVNETVKEQAARGKFVDARQVRLNLIRNGQSKLFICTDFSQVNSEVCVALRAFDQIIDKRFECLGCRAAGENKQCLRCSNNFYPQVNFKFHATAECKNCTRKGVTCYRCKDHWAEDKSMLPRVAVYNPKYMDRILYVHSFDEWMKIQDEAKKSRADRAVATAMSAAFTQMLDTKTPWLRLGCTQFETLRELYKEFGNKDDFMDYCKSVLDELLSAGCWDLDLGLTESKVDGNGIYWGTEKTAGAAPNTDEEYADAAYETHNKNWSVRKSYALTGNNVPAGSSTRIHDEDKAFKTYAGSDIFNTCNTSRGIRKLISCSGTRQFRKFESSDADILQAFLQITFYVAAGFKPMAKMEEVTLPDHPGFTEYVPVKQDVEILDYGFSYVTEVDSEDTPVEDAEDDVDDLTPEGTFANEDDYDDRYYKQEAMTATPIYVTQPTMLKQYQNAQGSINPDVAFNLPKIR